MEPSDENVHFWLKMENGLKLKIPAHITNTLKYKKSHSLSFSLK